MKRSRRAITLLTCAALLQRTASTRWPARHEADRRQGIEPGNRAPDGGPGRAARGHADLTKSSAPRTYRGPNRFAPGTPEVAELVRSGGFEGVLTWAIGLRDRVDFRVTTLESPPRLVVDFRNH